MSDGGQEVEAKLAVPSPHARGVIDDLRSRDSLDGLALGPAAEVHIEDVYLDTKRGAIGRWGGALRIRTQDGEKLITVKGPRVGADESTVTRSEIELAFTPDNVHSAMDWLRARLGEGSDLPTSAHVSEEPASIEGLSPIHERRTLRVTRAMPAQEPCAELAIDRAMYAIGGREVTLVEIEIEAKGAGGRGVVRRGASALLELYPKAIRAWRHSKLAVGLALGGLETGDLVDADGVLTAAGLARIDASLSGG
jgi:inorganic triphosphatase YgiF